MSMREIPEERWPAFLEEFSRAHRAWLATVERVPPGGPAQVEVLERPLDTVTPEVADDHVVRIRIHFQEGAPEAAVRVNAPTALRVAETTEGAAEGIEIEGPHGEWTRLRFRAAPLPEMLDGVAPGEV